MRLMQAFVVGVAIWSGTSMAALAAIDSIQEAELIKREFDVDTAVLPNSLPSGLARLIQLLEGISASDATKQEAQAFLQFLNDNPGAFAEDVGALTGDRLESYGKNLALGASALSALKPIADKLASSNWLQEADPTLAEDLRRECGRRTVSGIELFPEMQRILTSGGSVAEAASLSDDVDSTVTECLENLVAHAAALAEEIKQADEQVRDLQKKLEAAKAENPQDEDKITALETALNEAKERQRELENDASLAELLTLLIGLAQFVSGVVGLVASGGTCIPCGTEVLAGAYAVSKSLDAMNEDPGSVTETTPASYQGITPGAAPTAEELAAIETLINEDPNLEYIKPENPGGNYLVAKDKLSGDLVIIQIKEPQRLVIKWSNVELAQVVEGVQSKEELSSASWTSVRSLNVAASSVNVKLVGTLGQGTVEATFLQDPVDRPYSVTVERP